MDTIKYLNEKEVSKMTNIAVRTLQKHRCKKQGIPYIKYGRSIKYKLKDVISYLESKKVIPENA